MLRNRNFRGMENQMTEYVYRHTMSRQIAEDYIRAKVSSASLVELAQLMTIASGRLHEAGDSLDELHYYIAEKPKRRKDSK